MDTRATLIDQAIGIVSKLGYAGFSYADLSSAVGIRKASIHHHFPSKGDLGVAMVEAYRTTMAGHLAGILAVERTCAKRLTCYAGLYRAALKDKNGCLCGTLAAAVDDLPGPVREAIKIYYDENTAWIDGVLAQARASGEIGHRKLPTRQLAQMVLATLQGAMLTARAQDDVAVFDAAANAVIAFVRG